jgi:hypothetical protein
MATPSTVAAAGFFAAKRDGTSVGEALLELESATRGSLALEGKRFRLTANAAKKSLRSGASSLTLRIASRNVLTGTLAGDPLQLSRTVLRPIPAAELAQSDPGPAGALKAFLATAPDYAALGLDPAMFWYAFGPVLYRGRLDGTAKVLGIASDPGPTECLPFVRRTLVGDSGQKVQGFLAKLGLTRSYVLVNAFAVALRPSKASAGRKLLGENAALAAWRRGFYDRLLAGGAIQAVIAFGDNAQRAYELWAAASPAAAAVPVVKVAHPAAVDRDGSGNDPALKGWASAVKKLRKLVSPDPDGDPGGRTYGAYFTETDYGRVPRWDLPAAAPRYVGDDSWGRAAVPRHNNCCERPRPDDSVSLKLSPPPGQGAALRYFYENGKLDRTEDAGGKVVPTNPSGIPL